MNKRISVVMTTYNGERFIYKQLESIKDQTQEPDEVIIIDDDSQDGTYRIVSDYIVTNKLDKWILRKNDCRLGWKRNFRKGISLSSGDCIFFSDQDDVWNCDKVAIMSSLMRSKSMGALFAGNSIIDENDERIVRRDAQESFSKSVKRVMISPSFYAFKTLGCCMCISRNVADIYLSLNCVDSDHDSQCGRIAILYDSLWYYDAPVIKYRIHDNNTSAVSKECSYGTSTTKARIEELRNSIIWLRAVYRDGRLESMRKKLVYDAIRFQVLRMRYFKGDCSLVSLLVHKRMYPNLTMLAGDFAYRHGMNSTLGKIRWLIHKR